MTPLEAAIEEYNRTIVTVSLRCANLAIACAERDMTIAQRDARIAELTAQITAKQEVKAKKKARG